MLDRLDKITLVAAIFMVYNMKRPHGDAEDLLERSCLTAARLVDYCRRKEIEIPHED